MLKRLSDATAPVSGVVTIEARDASGRLVHRERISNTYTNLGASLYAQVLAGEAVSTTFTHIGLGLGGANIDNAETVTGWTGSPTLDSTTFRQGAASLRAVATASSTNTYYNATAIADYDASVATAVELWLRLLLRGYFDLATSEVRLYTGGGTSAYFRASLATIEAANGVAFQDATWKQSRIPVASFSVGAGSPNWAHLTGIGISVVANSSGTATLNWDGVRTIEPIDLTATASAVPNEPTRRALTSLTRAGRIVTADSFWTMSEVVDQYYCAGLYAGTVPVSILPFIYYKQAGLTLRVTWQITVNGG